MVIAGLVLLTGCAYVAENYKLNKSAEDFLVTAINEIEVMNPGIKSLARIAQLQEDKEKEFNKSNYAPGIEELAGIFDEISSDMIVRSKISVLESNLLKLQASKSKQSRTSIVQSLDAQYKKYAQMQAQHSDRNVQGKLVKLEKRFTRMLKKYPAVSQKQTAQDPPCDGQLKTTKLPRKLQRHQVYSSYGSNIKYSTSFAKLLCSLLEDDYIPVYVEIKKYQISGIEYEDAGGVVNRLVFEKSSKQKQSIWQLREVYRDKVKQYLSDQEMYALLRTLGP